MELAQPRSDAWYADLTEEQLWQLYAIAKRTHNWAEVARIAREEFNVERDISSSAFYRWRDWMRRQDADRRRVSIVAAQQEAAEIARANGIRSEVEVNALKALAIDAAMSNDAESALKWVTAAMAIRDRDQRDAELKLKSARQKTADEQLKLAREKFEAAEKRLKAVKDAVNSAKSKGGLTKETLRQIEEAAGLL